MRYIYTNKPNLQTLLNQITQQQTRNNLFANVSVKEKRNDPQTLVIKIG